jgi:hypothetical protein
VQHKATAPHLDSIFCIYSAYQQKEHIRRLHKRLGRPLVFANQAATPSQYAENDPPIAKPITAGHFFDSIDPEPINRKALRLEGKADELQSSDQLNQRGLR